MSLKLRIYPLEWKQLNRLNLTKWQRGSNRNYLLQKFSLMRLPLNYNRFPATSATKPRTELKRKERLKTLLQQEFLPSRSKNRERNQRDPSGVSQNGTRLEGHNGSTEKK